MVLIDDQVRRSFPGLRVVELQIEGLRVVDAAPSLEEEKLKVASEVRSKYTLESLKEQPLVRKYRDFFWEVGVDPTKTRPASEALIRRILSGRSIPTVNTLVDAYNIASVRSGVPIAAFDADRIGGSIKMRFARAGESFLGIGMEKEMRLRGVEVVLDDGCEIIAVYPYRDAERTKVTLSTKNAVLLICGVPGVEDGVLEGAKEVCQGIVLAYCGGRVVG
ncbi:MAG: phenylalanine--tRNA ligase beta subunit-related protein [Candidatus Verstraetearchaeota archaeon]|nr:phenylalanine--tRNA ligase beta subunit-related protein [Candidatus Verstraetearchaeota archaeon]